MAEFFDSDRDGINELDYDALMNAVFGAAIGDAEEVERDTVRTVEQVDADGTRRHVTSRSSRKDPDVALALKLLENRIGGPQDYC